MSAPGNPPEVVAHNAPADGARLLVHNHLTRDIKPEGECPRCDFDRKPLLASDEIQS